MNIMHGFRTDFVACSCYVLILVENRKVLRHHKFRLNPKVFCAIQAATPT